MTVLLVVTLLLAAAAATAVVVTRDPVAQVIVLGGYGLLLSFLFVLLQAPDVALSEVGVGGIAVPALLLLTLVRLRRSSRRAADTSPRT